MREPAERPLFSVIVPTCGRPEYLGEAVSSVLSQTCGDFECLVVDDGGGDPPTLPTDPRVRLIRRERNGGASAARNTGLDAARGQMIAFLDDDDVYLPNRLALAAAQAQAPILVGWRGRYGDPRATPVGPRVLEGDVSDSILDEAVPHLGTTTVRRELVVRFDETFPVSEDVEWWLRQARVAPVATTRSVVYLLREHSGERQTAHVRERLMCRTELLRANEDYFASHPRAAAFHWKRAGSFALVIGDRRQARRAYRSSFASRPSLRTAAGFARACRPGGG